MEMILVMIGVLTMMIVAAALGYLLGWITTETRFKIPIDVRPFNCRPCSSFWWTLFFEVFAVAVPFAYLIPSLGTCSASIGGVVGFLIGALALALSFIVFLYVKLKFKIYD